MEIAKCQEFGRLEMDKWNLTLKLEKRRRGDEKTEFKRWNEGGLLC
jgi:hypothetical protein